MLNSVGDVTQTLWTAQSERRINKELDKDAFLRLFITQLKNQNPLEPMDNTEFISQLAQFTALEQTTNMSKALQEFLASQESFSKLQAASLVGKNAVVSGKYVNLKDGSTDTIVFNLDTSTPITLEIYDQDGNLVRREDLGYLEAGLHSYVWDGRDAEGTVMPNGTYTYRLLGLDEYGNQTELGGLEGGRVEAVQFLNGEVYVVVNGIKYPISSIMEISE